MSSWAERVHRRAADLGNVVTSCGHPATAPSYPYRLEKVKFGVPLEEVCKHNNNIPGPLLVLILKLNKESPNRRDVFRAPGHQGAMKKLIHFLQAGRLVNVDNYSVFTIASVLKKFLRKIPNGIFGRSGEMELFAINDLQNESEQTERLHRLFGSLPKYTQHLLVLLFGTFRVIASNAAHASTGMTSEALGVSVAPSFFQSCVSDGKTARMEDVLKFKVSTKIMQNIIDKFATHDIFGRDNYEYYARVTGRILKVQDEWICSFQYPPPPRGKLAQQKYALQHSLEAEKTWLQCQCERWGLLAQEESRSTPALLTSSSSALENSVLSLGVSPEHSFIESCARLSVSLEGPGIYAMTSSPLPAKRNGNGNGNGNATDYDYDDYADDDEDNDELDGVHDFGAELEISSIAPPQGSRGIYRHKQRAQQPLHYQQQQPQLVQPQHQRDYDDDDDEDEDEMTFVKRRYRQNKKKPAAPSSSHHQRRLRTGTKSLDGGGERRAGSGSGAAGGSGGAAPGAAAGNPTPPKLKQRTCSRCNRGIRHSSSCSSNSAGAAGSNCGGGGSGGTGTGNGGGAEGGMTMEELRAVNRYAESTKSLSYLPQVHERQTARMRTRSEWFLGPRDAVVTLQLPADTCSSCCLAAAAGYLGGGSTRDMRQAQTEGERSQAALLYHFYRRQQQQQQQEQQEQHFDDMMDTEDSYGQQKEQQQQQQEQQQQQIHSKGLLRPPPMQHQQQQQQRRLLLDVNSVGNIRLSNSAESIQYAARRPVASLGLNPGLGGVTSTTHNPTTRRLLINVPRQYRSSLRRNKEKQIGGNSQSNSSNSLGSDQLTGNPGAVGGSAGGVSVLNKPLLMVGLLPGAEQPPSVRNSIAECGISTPDAMDVGVECSTTLSFKPPRL
ncbi:rho GTPase-activating protein gacU isoform X1 [Drosophila suzukii]|uniref:Rho GTPase-activating protein gacU isoform X1 n=1 Tax=Drosophila suzukii TaxID=28584 RepID=A0AB40A2X7_DROSZ